MDPLCPSEPPAGETAPGANSPGAAEPRETAGSGPAVNPQLLSSCADIRRFQGPREIVYRRIDELKLDRRKFREHSKRKIHKLAAAMAEYRHVSPVLTDAEDTVIAGGARILACRELGLSEVPTISLAHLTKAQRDGLMLADNRLAEEATWDKRLLGEVLRDLSNVELDFNLELTGFEMAEIDLLIADVNGEAGPGEDAADVSVEPATSPAVSKPGDLWLLGAHRVCCGSALDASALQILMGEERATMVSTDPPYNVPIDGHATGLGKIHHRSFAMASGEMSTPTFALFLTRSLRNLAAFCFGGALLYVCMDWRHMEELLAAGREVDAELLNLCVWAKDNGGMGSLYRSQHELVFVFKTGAGPHRNNVQLGRFGRNRSNVWRYPRVNSFSRKTDEGNLLALHPTVKPVALVADAILDCTARGDIVLDGFLGSGTTVIAAERTGRRCYGIELDPGYVDTIIRRWQKVTGSAATHAQTGRTFDDLAREAEVADAA